MTDFDMICIACLIGGPVLLILSRTILKEEQQEQQQQSTSPLPTPMVPKQMVGRANPTGNGEVCVLPLTESDGITLHQAFEGVLVMGGTGSGKTTGPGEELARNLLRAGAGFCVLTAKVDEYPRWVKLCQQTGRQADLIRFAPGEQWKCDLLEYELSHPDASIEAAAQLLDVLVEVSSRNSSGQGDEPFWALFAQKIFRRAIGAVWLGMGKCSLSDVYRLITSAPSSLEERDSEKWREGSFCYECIVKGYGKDKSRDFHLCADFWLYEWPTLSDKTRSVGYAMTTNVLDKFLSGPVADMVSSGETNLTPEDIARGKVVVLDMPVLRWRDPGQFFQIIFKVLTQRATLRRDLNGNPKPVVVWADEAQFFIVPDGDVMTQTVARQSRLISVVLTQNLPMLYAAMGGGDKAKQETDGWLSNHSTKLLCANADKETNEYFSELLGHSRHMFMSGHTDQGPYDFATDVFGGSASKGSAGFNEQWHPDVPPESFTKLMKGGIPNDCWVSAYCFQGGRIFSNEKTWCVGHFKQRF